MTEGSAEGNLVERALQLGEALHRHDLDALVSLLAPRASGFSRIEGVAVIAGTLNGRGQHPASEGPASCRASARIFGE